MSFIPDDFLLLAGAIAVGASTGVSILYSNTAIARRRLRSASLHAIRRFPHGKAGRIQGVVSCAAEPLTSPIDGLPCVAYWACIGDARGSRVPMVVKASCTFLVEDETGRAVILPRGAIFDLRTRSRVEQDPNATTGLKRLLIDRERWDLLAKASVLCEERILQEGDRVAIFGTGRLEPDPDPDPATASGGYRERPTRLLLGPTRAGWLLISDDSATLGS